MVPLPYLGIWRRDWIDRYDEHGAARREYRPAIWFQSRSYHVDLRIDPALAHLSMTASADVFAQSQIAFAGSTVVRTNEGREICQWHPRIAYPRLTGETDAGFMHFTNATHLMEQGLDGRYQESWQRLNDDEEAIHCLRFVSADASQHETFLMLGETYFALGSNYPEASSHPLPIYAWGERCENNWIVHESLAPWHVGKLVDIDPALQDAATTTTPRLSAVDCTLPLMPNKYWRLLEVD